MEERTFYLLAKQEKFDFLSSTVSKFMFESGQVLETQIVLQTVESLLEYLDAPMFRLFTVADVRRAFANGTAAATEYIETRVTVVNVRKWLLKERFRVMEQHDKAMKAQELKRIIKEPQRNSENLVFADAILWGLKVKQEKKLTRAEFDTLELEEIVNAIKNKSLPSLIETAKQRVNQTKKTA